MANRRNRLSSIEEFLYEPECIWIHPQLVWIHDSAWNEQRIADLKNAGAEWTSIHLDWGLRLQRSRLHAAYFSLASSSVQRR